MMLSLQEYAILESWRVEGSIRAVACSSRRWAHIGARVNREVQMYTIVVLMQNVKCNMHHPQPTANYCLIE